VGRVLCLGLKKMFDNTTRTHDFQLNRASQRIRPLDAVLATLAFLVLSPLFLILIVVVCIDSPGPAIFRQTRLGQNLRPFTLYKFRTMYRDAAQRFPELYDYNTKKAAEVDFLFKMPIDPRVTRIGRRLRRSGLDELPNLLNVIKGDCALVGPRPDIPEMLPNYTVEQRIRFSVLPGVVSLAHIRGGNHLTFSQTADFDAEYVRRRSLWLDMKILALVSITIMKGDLF
jgi:lipopolysaccharide/colanic/teichoic acid biosynthesis glycosyltransferase